MSTDITAPKHVFEIALSLANEELRELIWYDKAAVSTFLFLQY